MWGKGLGEMAQWVECLLHKHGPEFRSQHPRKNLSVATCRLVNPSALGSRDRRISDGC